MQNKPEQKIADIVRSNYRTADVFKRYGISYCCNGMMSLNDACILKELDPETVVCEIEEAGRIMRLPAGTSFVQWPIGFLLDYLVNIHHAYLYNASRAITDLLTAFVVSHKKQFPELISIEKLFSRLTQIAEEHSRYEEEIVFPYIRQVSVAFTQKESYGGLLVKTLRKPLSNDSPGYNHAIDLLKELKRAAFNFKSPKNACISHQVIYHKLEEFHDDMLQHFFLENNVLFPRVTAIERQLLQL